MICWIAFSAIELPFLSKKDKDGVHLVEHMHRALRPSPGPLLHATPSLPPLAHLPSAVCQPIKANNKSLFKDHQHSEK